MKPAPETFAGTPPALRAALQGVSSSPATLNTRDAALRNLLANANKVTSVLAKRGDQIAAWWSTPIHCWANLSRNATRSTN